MTLLSIGAALAKNVGMTVPDIMVSSPERQWLEAVQFANETGEELARRVDWGQLQESTTLTGTGAAISYTLPTDFSRLNQGVAITNAAGGIVRPLTRQEWSNLSMVEGVPRYFLLENNTLQFWPYLANTITATAQYQSKDWCSAGAEFIADTDTVLVDEILFTKGLIVRWRRQKQMDVTDYEAEYEAALTNFARFNDRSRL
jgi:hypothetical protein